MCTPSVIPNLFEGMCYEFGSSKKENGIREGVDHQSCVPMRVSEKIGGVGLVWVGKVVNF